MRSWWGEGVGSCIEFVMAVDIRPTYFHAVVADFAGVACAGPLLGSRLFDTVPLRWGPLHCRVPCRVPFAENVGCWVAEMLPAVGIVSIAGIWTDVPAIAVLVPLGVPAIAAGGGRWWSTHVPVLVLFHCLMCLHLCVVWLLHLHHINHWSSLAYGRHLKL